MSKTLTLESVQAEQKKLDAMIAQLVAQAKTEFAFPETEIQLSHGEHYAGLILGKNGESSYHLVLLPDEAEDVNWKDAGTWAKKAGGELPTRREQSLLFANLKEEFSENWYWSQEQRASSESYAWMQYFGNGSQLSRRKGSEYRARAVRRLPIE